jgi:hypothetical protein
MTKEQLKEKAERRERILDLLASGFTCVQAAHAAGVSVQVVYWARERARRANDARGAIRKGGHRAGSILGVPPTLQQRFLAEAAKRKIGPAELRRRILTIVTRDGLFEALDLDDLRIEPEAAE